jgi:polyisoprenoid-binding protein YceI
MRSLGIRENVRSQMVVPAQWTNRTVMPSTAQGTPISPARKTNGESRSMAHLAGDEMPYVFATPRVEPTERPHMSTVDQAVLPAGTWKVDLSESQLGFMARGVWGLVPVKGKFEQFEGELTVDGAGARGELSIVADSLNTKNSQRDKHLRSADFFEVDKYPTVKFTLTGISPGDEPQVTGVLTVKDKPLEVTFPLHVHGHDDHLHLATELKVERDAAGLGWSKGGAIKGPAHLSGDVLLVRQG